MTASPWPEPDSLTQIWTGPDLPRIADQTRAALAQHPDLYLHHGEVVRIVAGRPNPLRANALRLACGEVAEYLTTKAKKGGETQVMQCPPPQWLGPTLLEDARWSELRQVDVVAEGPLLGVRALLDGPGYHPASRALCTGPVVGVPLHPSPAQVQAALAALADVVCDFPFRSEADYSAWLASVLTPMCRVAFDGPAPLFVTQANAAGSGKTYLAQIAGCIATGHVPSVNPYPKNDEELEKTITARIRSGDAVGLLDNASVSIGGGALDAVVTARSYSSRVLGKSEVFHVPRLTTTWYVTGNNAPYHADTARRVLPIHLEARQAKPEERQGFRHRNIMQHVRQHRSALACAAGTLLAAYASAGLPAQGLPPLGSFEGWSDLVRGCLVWLGKPDPLLSREGIDEADSSATEHERLLALCAAMFGAAEFTVGDLASRVESGLPEHILCPGWTKADGREVLQELGVWEQGSANRRKLGRRIADRQKRRGPGGEYLDRAGKDRLTKVGTWRVVYG